MDKINPEHNPEIVRHVRAFWLKQDPLGVYHPDNGNEDEYDAYIDDTIAAIRRNELSGDFANRMFIAMYGNITDSDFFRIADFADAFHYFKVAVVLLYPELV